ncbi:acetyltransferase-like isoleucine patch superfamily enzyme [Neobacillus bataviensis]|uniref:Acetyltransferase-like isoleucine patch superfamily enzyme n=1 Tax=Neobacillus bataviensis TaxID=220685 RepID=A0A561D646_9BACI|nr:acyltransferase [Neobacillus bataviensis]TWD98911.1 acetyltransferase-like isoleucine patch superfamily enzyme [Neobacillus bataviensis]
MVNIFKKIIMTLLSEIKKRGLFITILMNLSHLIGITRGLFYKVLYFRNINSTFFSLQANSKIEVFNKKAKITMGKFVFIRKNASIRIDFDGVLQIGNNVFINDNCNINCVNRITIGKNTKIAPNVCINDHDHNYKKNTTDHLIRGEVTIGENVWVGSNVVILRDTHIGDNVVVAAGSVVKGTIPSNTIFLNKRETELKPYKGKEKVVQFSI